MSNTVNWMNSLRSSSKCISREEKLSPPRRRLNRHTGSSNLKNNLNNSASGKPNRFASSKGVKSSPKKLSSQKDVMLPLLKEKEEMIAKLEEKLTAYEDQIDGLKKKVVELEARNAIEDTEENLKELIKTFVEKVSDICENDNFKIKKVEYMNKNVKLTIKTRASRGNSRKQSRATNLESTHLCEDPMTSTHLCENPMT